MPFDPIMNIPTLDIIVPVWNQPFETRACLVSIASSHEEPRIIIINNGCNRDTELLLEEFSDSLGDRAIYMTMERNIGFIPAVNHGLQRSDANWAMVMRPTGVLHDRAVTGLLHSIPESAGILSPLCKGEDIPWKPESYLPNGFVETNDLSFAAIAVSKTLRSRIGLFSEHLDGDFWTLKDYRCRCSNAGFTVHSALTSNVTAGARMIFGSAERRSSIAESSRASFAALWGEPRQFGVYVSKETPVSLLKDMLDEMLVSVRKGNLVYFLVPRPHAKVCRKNGWDRLHTDLRMIPLSMLFTERDAAKHFKRLGGSLSNLLAVKAPGTGMFPGADHAISFTAAFSEEIQ